MKVLVAGHKYELDNFEKSVAVEGEKVPDKQTIQFIHKELDKKSKEKALKTVTNGTTSEELLSVLIDRTQFFIQHSPVKFMGNDVILEKLQDCLEILEKRTEMRIRSNVEGKQKK
jgi:hypothetical protein